MKKFAFALILSILISTGTFAGEKIRIGYACCNFNDIFQIYVVDAAKVAAGNDIVLEITDAQEDVVRQQDQVMTMIQSGLDALVVVPVDTSAVNGIVSAAREANLPLVFVNRNPYPDGNIPENIYFIGADEGQMGEEQMKYAGQKMGGEGNIVILMGILSNEATLARTQGNHDIIKALYPNIKILAEETGNWQQDQGLTVMENWITAYGNRINAVVSNNDNMVLGAISALEVAGMKDNVITVGIDATTDALEAILAGRLDATVLQDPVIQGRGAIEMVRKIMKGEKVPQMNKMPAKLITRENAQEQLDKSK